MAQTKHWVITGASRGIGLEIVKQLLDADEQVTALARNSANAPELQELSDEHPARLRVVDADVTKEIDLDRAVKAIDGVPVDILINNAGVYKESDGRLSELDPKTVEQTFLVNSLGPLRVTRAFLPLLSKSKSPVIANITSLMGSISDNASGGSYAYRMSKAALNMFTKNLSLELKNSVVLSLHPGWVKTDMGGPSAPTEKRESAAGLIKTIRSATREQSGGFYNFRGENLSW